MAGPFCFGGWAAGIEGTRHSRPGKGLGKGQVRGQQAAGAKPPLAFYGRAERFAEAPRIEFKPETRSAQGRKPISFHCAMA